MLQVDLETSVGNLGVETTHYRGHTPEEWAKMAANRIRKLQFSVGHRTHEINSPARTVVLVAGFEVSGTGGRA